jgi:hypothetical protein
MPDYADYAVIDHFVGDRNSLFRVVLVIAYDYLYLFAKHSALLVPLFNREGYAILKVHPHLGLIAGHGACNADLYHVLLFLASNRNKNDKHKE